MSSILAPSAALALVLGFVATPAEAWTPAMHVEIARQAATIAPPDLLRQIQRNEKAFEAGLASSIGDRSHSDSGGALLSRLRDGSERIVDAITNQSTLCATSALSVPLW